MKLAKLFQIQNQVVVLAHMVTVILMLMQAQVVVHMLMEMHIPILTHPQVLVEEVKPQQPTELRDTLPNKMKT